MMAVPGIVQYKGGGGMRRIESSEKTQFGIRQGEREKTLEKPQVCGSGQVWKSHRWHL
jgi:hypothetical protein